jgi:hypothetical protein
VDQVFRRVSAVVRTVLVRGYGLLEIPQGQTTFSVKYFD